MVNEPTSITTEPTEFSLEGHRPCQHCGYDLVGTPIERALELDLAVIRCPECGNLNPLIGTPPLGPFAQRAATVGTLVRLLLIGIAAISLWNVAFFSVEAMGESMYRSQVNEGLMDFLNSTGNTPDEQRALKVLDEDNATVADLITAVTLYQERTASRYNFTKMFPSRINELLGICFFLGLVGSWLLLPLGWKRSGMLTLIVGMLAAGAGVASLYAKSPLSQWVQNPRTFPNFAHSSHSVVIEASLERMYALPAAVFIVITLVISSVLARPLARKAFQLLVPIEHLSGVALLWKADGLPMPSAPPANSPKVVNP